MVRDHGAANARLMGLSRRIHMGPAPVGPVDNGALESLSGREFDRAYIDNQIQAHQATIAAFEAEASGGQNQALRQFARSSLPMLHAHLRQAEAIARRMGR
jgi:putative membrane protein